jgi:hypothetical protein
VTQMSIEMSLVAPNSASMRSMWAANARSKRYHAARGISH